MRSIRILVWAICGGILGLIAGAEILPLFGRPSPENGIGLAYLVLFCFVPGGAIVGGVSAALLTRK